MTIVNVMAITLAGAQKIAAQKIGISLEEYLGNIQNGFKWCFRCRTWQRQISFQRDRSRGDGLKADCKPCQKKRKRPKQDYTLPQHQARYQVMVAVRYKRLPPAKSLPCTDCNQIWQEGLPRHEYDHYKGYAAEHYLTVQVVCQRCHQEREMQRKSNGRK